MNDRQFYSNVFFSNSVGDLYLEFDALSRLGIPDAVSYVKKRYKTTQLLFLKAACVGQGLVDQVEASVEEAISSGTWVDIAVCFILSL